MRQRQDAKMGSGEAQGTAPLELGPNSAWAKMLATEGQTVVLSATRDAAAVLRDGQHTTISAEVMEQMLHEVKLWLGSRLVRHSERTGRGAHNIEITVTVNTAAGVLEPGAEPPTITRLSVIDGRVQLEAMRS